jgi:glycosyltransferase involved in cell wall biosynthesis
VTPVSLVVTVRNEAATIRELLSSIDAQTRAPDEVVVVDGGSDDETLRILDQWTNERRVVLSEPGANIARGRNTAISHTSCALIAVTDAGCVLDKHWLERLTTRLDRADVAMGFYEPIATTFFERVTTALTLPDAREIDPAKFMPSSRSIAFKREVWERVGGYPEWLDVGEDMYFNFAVLHAGAKRVFAPDAVVRWHTRPTLRAFLRQYFRYARGDAIAGMYPRRHAIRFISYSATVVLVALSVAVSPWLVAIPVFGITTWLRPAYGRVLRRMRGAGRIAGLVLVPFLLILQDVAKMAGYIAGLPHRRKR